MDKSGHHYSSASVKPSGMQKAERGCIVTMEEIEKDLKALVGLGEVKEKLLELASTLQAMSEHNAYYGLNNMPFHCLIEGPEGSGKRQVAIILAKILRLVGIVRRPIFVLEHGAIERGRSSFERLWKAESRSVYLDELSKLLPKGTSRGGVLPSFWSTFKENLDNHSLLIGLNSGNRERLFEMIEIEQQIDFIIEIPPYNEDDFLKYARKYAAKRKFKLSKSAVGSFLMSVNEEQEKPDFANMDSVQQIIDRAIMHCFSRMEPNIQRQGKAYTPLLAKDFVLAIRQEEQKNEEYLNEKDAFEELESFIGLEEVKAKIHELMAIVSLQQRRKEAGFSNIPICTHMAFSGSPGTGKTTVARLVGRILKQMGILEQGHFVEVSREDLVGEYIGHTAVKTANQIELALGGVLFVDECYSLFNPSKRDFGHEAIATLVKAIEDHRDNLTIILAGYSKEMESFIDMNPGLKSRIQFHIDFPDYNPQELLAIFEKLCSDEGYELCSRGAKELENIFKCLYKKRDANFANGRLARQLFERAKLALALRVFPSKGNVSLNLITLADIVALRQYSDIRKTSESTELRRIGFVTDSA